MYLIGRYSALTEPLDCRSRCAICEEPHFFSSKRSQPRTHRLEHLWRSMWNGWRKRADNAKSSLGASLWQPELLSSGTIQWQLFVLCFEINASSEQTNQDRWDWALVISGQPWQRRKRVEIFSACAAQSKSQWHYPQQPWGWAVFSCLKRVDHGYAQRWLPIASQISVHFIAIVKDHDEKINRVVTSLSSRKRRMHFQSWCHLLMTLWIIVVLYKLCLENWLSSKLLN